jgi:hypothetical protein
MSDRVVIIISDVSLQILWLRAAVAQFPNISGRSSDVSVSPKTINYNQ